MKRNVVLFVIAALLVLTLAVPALLPNATSHAPVDEAEDGTGVAVLIDFDGYEVVADPECPHTGGQSCGG